MAKRFKLALCFACLVGLLLWKYDLTASGAQTQSIDFTRDIEPIFRANCAGCHGEKKAAGQLRLDNKALAMKGGINGAVIVPGKSAESRLVHRILGEGGEKRMPLGGEALKPEQIQLIRAWIDQGAVWPVDAGLRTPDAGLPKHWAFVAPKRPALPTLKNPAWVRTPIDAFVLAELEKHGLQPSPEADRTTLIRRLYLDLLGLPPTPNEVDAFVADAAPDAWEKLVERVLANPHYGERWGRWWLDAARYADTNGYEKDRTRSIWPYRDWVIKALNQDLSFDRFAIEQLAGDLLPNPTLDQRVATGFLRNSMLNQEGGTDPEQFRVEGVIDRVDAIGKAFLGLTVNCAQCHTHKFDPIQHSEYYRFYAFLNNDDEPEIEVPDAKLTAARNEILAKVAKVEDEAMAKDPDLAKRMAAWEAKVRTYDIPWTPLKTDDIYAAFGVKFDVREDGSFVARGDNATTNNYIVRVKSDLKKITGFRIELLTDPNLPRTGPGRAPDGSFYFSEFAVEAARPDKPEALEKVALSGATADFSLPDFPAANVIDGNMKTHWYSDAGPVRRNQDRQFVFTTAQPVGYDGGAYLVFQIAQKRDDTIDSDQKQPNIGRFRLSVTDAPNPTVDPLPANIRRLLAVPAAQRTPAQQREIFGFYRTADPAYAEANKKIDEIMKEWPYGPTTLALVTRQVPRVTRVFKRGDWKRPGDVVTPGVPASLHPLQKDAPPNRLGLAKWIVDRDNPLTARVIVNRIWQQYFGQGLVTTPEDFGSRCELPSHPALLDWLAVEFMSGGEGERASGRAGDKTGVRMAADRRPPTTDHRSWSIKHIHRLIVNSATYRQSSKVTPKLLEADPYNRWIARMPRLRVEAEIIRDISLAASGLLNPKIGGPSVYPPLPAGVMDLAYAGFKWENASGQDRFRRGMYIFWKRSVPYPAMTAFDQPNGESSCTRRVTSNTPLQALTTLNDKTFMEAAQGLALRVWKEGGGDDQAKMTYAFRLCVGRKPDAFELGKLMGLLEEQKKYFAGRTAAAVYVTARDLTEIPDDLDLHQVAPWTIVARVLLNMDETITRE